jgi:hypothetical protein
MEDRLISLEAAILAKNKGYNQNPYKVPYAYGPTYTDGSEIKLRSSSLFNPDSNTAIAPTQSLLQKWLREEHNIIVLVDVFLGKFICKVNNIIVTNNKTGDILKYNTYEEALEIGLIEGLNRI